MTKNVCAVRLVKAMHEELARWSRGLARQEPSRLPHEPVMNETTERWGSAQKENRLLAVDPRNSFDAVYVCKHCGCLYTETPEEGRREG